MDLNALFFHHQTAIMNGAATSCDQLQASNFELAEHYAKRIGAERRRMGYLGRGWDLLPASAL